MNALHSRLFSSRCRASLRTFPADVRLDEGQVRQRIDEVVTLLDLPVQSHLDHGEVVCQVLRSGALFSSVCSFQTCIQELELTQFEPSIPVYPVPNFDFLHHWRQERQNDSARRCKSKGRASLRPFSAWRTFSLSTWKIWWRSTLHPGWK